MSIFNPTVLISGTPANNQLAVWTGANTIEGDPGVTWDGTSQFNVLAVDGNFPVFNYIGYAASASSPVYVFRKGRGTEAAPAVPLSGDLIGSLAYQGHSGSGTTWIEGPDIQGIVEETFSTTTGMSGLRFRTTPTGAIEPTERMRITGRGNITIGNNPGQPTTGTLGLFFADGTAPATLATNTAGWYADDVAGTVEMFGIDEAGNTSQQTPHNFILFSPESGEPYPWSYYAKNDYLGIEMAVDWGKALRLLGTLFPTEKFIYRKALTVQRNWADDQEANMRKRMSNYEQWERSDRTDPQPPVPLLKMPPPWLKERLIEKSRLDQAKMRTLQEELNTWKAARGL